MEGTYYVHILISQATQNNDITYLKKDLNL